MDDCIHCANLFGQKLAETLHVPGETPPYVEIYVWYFHDSKMLNAGLLNNFFPPQFFFMAKQLEEKRGEASRRCESESTKLYLRR